MTKLTIDFEIAPRGTSTPIPDGYDGFIWDHFGARDARPYDNGYKTVLNSGHDVGFTNDYSIAMPTMSVDSGTFSLRGGHFASAWTDGNVVTFFAFLDGVQIGKKTVTFNMDEDTYVHFGRKFAGIDEIRIEQGNGQIGMDDLVVVLPDGDGAHTFAHAGGWHDPGVWHGEPFA